MYALMLAALFAPNGKPAEPQIIPPLLERLHTPVVSIEGDWIVLAAEKNGRPVGEGVHTTANVKDNVMTFTSPPGILSGRIDGTSLPTLWVEFGPGHTIRVLEA